jgi:hypothetical protein
MVQLSDDDHKEIFLSDLYYGMMVRDPQGRVYSQHKFDTIDNMLNELHQENHRND